MECKMFWVFEQAWTVTACIVNIRARKLIANQPKKREDVLKERLPLCACAPMR